MSYNHWKAVAMNWHAKHKNSRVTQVKCGYRKKKGWEQYFLLSSDRHLDHPLSREDLQKKHLKQAMEREAGIIDIGDFYCAMQGKSDKRGDKASVRPGHQKKCYFDSIVDSGVEFFKPYLENLIILGKGNHETSVLRHNETDLTERTTTRLNELGANVGAGSYSGWIKFEFLIGRSSYRQGFALYYDHGSGGSAPVTLGVIQTNRNNATIDGADILVSGHNHNSWYVETEKLTLSAGLVEKRKTCHHVKIPSYKDAMLGQTEGYEVEKGAGLKPLGAWWLRFYIDDGSGQIRIGLERAK